MTILFYGKKTFRTEKIAQTQTGEIFFESDDKRCFVFLGDCKSGLEDGVGIRVASQFSFAVFVCGGVGGIDDHFRIQVASTHPVQRISQIVSVAFRNISRRDICE